MLQLTILFVLWVLYFVLHSVLASTKFKIAMQRLLKTKYKYYRLFYSLFAVVTLILIVLYSVSISTYLLWRVQFTQKILSVIMMIAGSGFILLFAKKLFFYLSGADVLRNRQMPRQLLQSDFYSYVRHPLYSATLIFIWGIFLFAPSPVNLTSCICITIYTITGSYFEEKKLIAEFGESYVLYKMKTPMLIPNIFRLGKPVD